MLEERAMQAFGFNLDNLQKLSTIEKDSGEFLSNRKMLNAFRHLHVEFDGDSLPVMHCTQTSRLCDVRGEQYKLTLTDAMKEALLGVACERARDGNSYSLSNTYCSLHVL